MPVTPDDIKQAARLIEGSVIRTPLVYGDALSRRLGTGIWVKHENMQLTHSFKARGALVKLLSLSEEERKRGVIAMSAGNHAQAVALHAQRLNIPALIVMPETTPIVKIKETEAFGAQIVLDGETLAESQVRAEKIAGEQGLTLVPPYDDDAIIAGQGTLALEMLEDNPDLDIIVVPIGGGGLISGVSIAAKAIKPDITIIGVEAALYPSMSGALKGEAAVCGGQTLAEGIAVKNVTPRTVEAVRAHVAEIVVVDEETLERAIYLFLNEHKTLAEGAGAAGLAAMLSRPDLFDGKKTGLVLCGGNMDTRILASVIFRSLGREKQIISLRIEISDRPGELGRVAGLIGNGRGNIVEVSHRRLFLDIPARQSMLDMMIETRGVEHAQEIISILEKDGLTVRVLESYGASS
ncbi:MAG: threonine ammonia-lyase [Parvularculales bacterium]